MRRLTLLWLWLNVYLVSRGKVNSVKASLLCFSINDIWIARFCRRLVAICAQGLVPICIANTVLIISSGRTAMGTIILRTTENVVERLTIINSNFVVLGNRHVIDETERLREIETFIQASVTTK